MAGAPAADASAPPSIRREGRAGTPVALLAGQWNLRSTRLHTTQLLADLTRLAREDAAWDLTQLKDLDAAGATLLWHAWGGRRPARLRLRAGDERHFERLAALTPLTTPSPSALADIAHPFLSLLLTALALWRDSLGVVRLLGAIILSSARLLTAPAEAPWREISATIYHSGLRSLPITTLVGLLIGIVLSYLIGEQLHDFGADGYIVNLMGITSLRELGPLIAAILNAGRSGSSMTAQIGLMRVTAELDALSVLGISHTLRLVLPRVLGQIIALPLLTLWTDAAALLGGMLGAKLQLGVSCQAFLHGIPQVVPLSNLWFGLAKGAAFGGTIALVACYFGLAIRPDTEGLASGTTESVVSALTLVLMLDAISAMLFAYIGL